METTIRTSNKLFEKLKEFEGCRLEAYKCPAGVWTIGYGHTNGVKPTDKISQWCAEDFLRKDIIQVEQQVLRLRCCQTQGELDACVSFVFNLGIGNFKRSTLYRLIAKPERNIEKIVCEFLRWKYAGGKVLPGLIKRRAWEAQRFFENSQGCD